MRRRGTPREGAASTSHLRQNEFWRAAVRATKRRHPDATFPAPRHTSRHQTVMSAPSRQWRSLITARSPRRGRLPRNAEHLRSRRPRVLGKKRRGDSCTSASRASRVPVSGATCDAGARHPPQRARRPPRPSCARSLPLARSRWRRRLARTLARTLIGDLREPQLERVVVRVRHGRWQGAARGGADARGRAARATRVKSFEVLRASAATLVRRCASS